MLPDKLVMAGIIVLIYKPDNNILAPFMNMFMNTFVNIFVSIFVNIFVNIFAAHL